jgi:hypothetical protein
MTDIPDPNKIEEYTERIVDAGNATQSLNLGLERTRKLHESFDISKIEALGKSAGLSSEDVNRLSREFKKLQDGVKGFKFDSDPLGDLMKATKPSDVRDAIGNAMVGAAQMINQAFSSMEEIAKNTTQAVAAIGVIGFAKAKVGAIELLNTRTGYVDLEKQLMDTQKAALQMGVSFGESYSDAANSVGFFQSSMAESIKTIKATEEELKATRGAMQEAFASREMFDNIEGLDSSLQGVRSSVNLTNAALAISKATGMDVADVAGKMADMHLRLGTSLKDTALAFGHIRAVAKDSGLTYKTVSDTVIDSAKTLKFYGATVESVSPIFKAFNQSLKGIGKEGLTPELLKDFVGGLQQMQLNTRALLGLRMPGAGAGGAGILGGALRVERAMETGEGMGDVVKSLTDTMKQFGGQRLVTREEAIESPAAERNYVIQRQILGQLTGIKDAGKQNQMMQILQDIDKHGVEASGGAEEKLGELMASGEKTAEETTDSLTKAQLEYQRTRMAQGAEMLGHLKVLATEAGVRRLLKSSEEVIDAVTGSIGDINFEVVEATLSNLGKEQAELTSALKDQTITEKQKKTVAREMKETVVEKTTLGMTAEYNRAILAAIKTTAPDSKERQRFIKTGAVTQSIHTEALKAAQKSANDRLTEIKDLLKRPDIKADEKRALRVEREGIRSAIRQMGTGKKLRMADRPEESTTRNRELRQRENVANVQAYRRRQRERAEMIGGQATTTRGGIFSYENVQRRLGREQGTMAVPINTDEDRRQRARTGLAPTATPRPVPGAPATMHEITATPVTPRQELGGEITVRIQVDQEGRLMTEDQVVKVVDGRIKSEALGTGDAGQ